MNRPKVNIPAEVKIASMMLSLKNGGKSDRTYIKSMCTAIHQAEKHKNASMKQYNKDLADD